MKKRIAFVLLVCALLSALCSCAVKKESASEAATAVVQPTTGKIYGKVTLSGATHCYEVIVTVTGGGWSYSTTADAEGNYSLDVDPASYTEIDFDCLCWSRTYRLKDPVVIAAGAEVKMPDYNLSPDHFFELEEETSDYAKYVCVECEEEKVFELGAVSPVKWAGIRVSSYGIRGSYGEDNFPSPSGMADIIGKMEGLYEGSTGACIMIVGTVSERTWDCHLYFPTSRTINRVNSSEEDFYEPYLSALDKAGYEVWLQVEPGDADLVELATEVMNHYKHHSCVKGFGIDVEWHKTAGTNGYGVKLDNETAAAVLDAVRAVDPSYTLFVKHWDERWLPEPAEGLIFVNDSQQFRSLEQMQEEFSAWAFTFEPCPVMFQIGYQADRRVWGSMENPAEELGKALQSQCMYGNDLGIIWVDFSLKEVMDKVK